MTKNLVEFNVPFYVNKLYKTSVSVVAHVHLFIRGLNLITTCTCPQMGARHVYCPNTLCLCTKFIMDVTLSFSVRVAEGISFLFN
jgi:hypothetical protein